MYSANSRDSLLAYGMQFMNQVGGINLGETPNLILFTVLQAIAKTLQRYLT